jgi:hypothetical protein
VFHIHALKENYTYVVNQHMHTDKYALSNINVQLHVVKRPGYGHKSDRNMQVGINE